MMVWFWNCHARGPDTFTSGFADVFGQVRWWGVSRSLCWYLELSKNEDLNLCGIHGIVSSVRYNSSHIFLYKPWMKMISPLLKGLEKNPKPQNRWWNLCLGASVVSASPWVSLKYDAALNIEIIYQIQQHMDWNSDLCSSNWKSQLNSNPVVSVFSLGDFSGSLCCASAHAHSSSCAVELEWDN